MTDDRLQTRLNKRVAETAKDVKWVWCVSLRLVLLYSLLLYLSAGSPPPSHRTCNLVLLLW